MLQKIVLSSIDHFRYSYNIQLNQKNISSKIFYYQSLKWLPIFCHRFEINIRQTRLRSTELIRLFFFNLNNNLLLFHLKNTSHKRLTTWNVNMSLVFAIGWPFFCILFAIIAASSNHRYIFYQVTLFFAAGCRL